MTHRERLEEWRDQISASCQRLSELDVTAHAVAQVAEYRDALQWALDEIDRLQAAIDEHNSGCQQACGEGDQEAVQCKYRPYFLNNRRRCPDCPVYWKIDLEDQSATTPKE